METISIDRTNEVENRVKAICIQPGDGCSFFHIRSGCVMAFHECRYCAYGKFDTDAHGELISGLCKYRR